MRTAKPSSHEATDIFCNCSAQAVVTAPPPASTSGATCGSKESSTPAVSMIEGEVCGNRNCSANCKILTNDE